MNTSTAPSEAELAQMTRVELLDYLSREHDLERSDDVFQNGSSLDSAEDVVLRTLILFLDNLDS